MPKSVLLQNAEQKYTAALANFNSITEDQYQYKVTIATKQKKYFLGIRYKSKWSYHDEIRINYDAYNRAKEAARVNLDTAGHELETQRQSEIVSLRSEISSAERALSYSQSTYNNAYRDHSAANTALLNKQAEVRALTSQVNASTAAVNTLKDRIGNLERNLAEKKELLNDLDEALAKRIADCTEQQRAALFVAFSNRPGKEAALKLITHLGLDISYVALKAIETGREDLLDYAIARGIDPDKDNQDGVSLLRLAVTKFGPDSLFVRKLAEISEDLSCSVLGAIKEDDTLTLAALLEIRPEIAVSRIGGLNILQLAISAGSKEVATLLLVGEYGESLCYGLSSMEDSSLIFALKADNAEFAELLLAKGVDPQQELIRLIEREDLARREELIAKLITLRPESTGASVVFCAVDKKDDIALNLLLNAENSQAAMLKAQIVGREDLAELIRQKAVSLGFIEEEQKEEVISGVDEFKDSLVAELNAEEAEFTVYGDNYDNFAADFK